MTMSKFDADPEAIAWARAKIQKTIDRMQQMSKSERLPEENCRGWRRAANLLKMELMGGEGCVIAAFDERLPELAPMFEEAMAREAQERAKTNND